MKILLWRKILKYGGEKLKEYLEEKLNGKLRIEERKITTKVGECNILLVKSRDVPKLVERYPKEIVAGITGKDCM